MGSCQQDYQTETVAYNGFRYSVANISSVADQSGVHQIYSNGEFRFHHVDTTRIPFVNGSGPDGAGITDVPASTTSS